MCNATVRLCNGKRCAKGIAHTDNLKHFAFSVFVFNSKHELLMQKRAMCKYHSGGLWSNTCCGHPLQNKLDDIKGEAKKRLEEEMGISCDLEFAGVVEYQINCGTMYENEFDYVFVGYYNDNPHINQTEVESYRWVDMKEINTELQDRNNRLTGWFEIIMKSNVLNKYIV